MAGIGNYSFIYNTEEVNAKVIESLSKSNLEYLLIKEAKILDASGNVINQIANLPLPL